LSEPGIFFQLLPSFDSSHQKSRSSGASCITAYDALGGLLTFDELIAKIDAGWEKN
jgi:hypothetical protein